MFGRSFLKRRRPPRKFGEDVLRHSIDGVVDRRRQSSSDVEPFAFDQIHDEAAGQLAECAGKLYRLGNPKGMSRAARKGDKGQRAV
jgi:hypothetical protein